jgi:glycosyltransferase involved in cell wall biosynthesis
MLAWKIVSDKRSVTIYSGIDFASYISKRKPSEMKRMLGLDTGWPIVGSVGRLSEQKAQHYLVEGIGLLKNNYPNIKLVLVGEGILRARLEKQIQDLGLSFNVLLLGERDDIADLLNFLDIYAMSSQWEGVGRALTEAMYFGLPIVATGVNGVKEIILHEQTGLLVPPRNPGALAAAIDRLVDDRSLAKRVGTNAKRMAEDLMSGERMIRDLERLYDEM